MAFDFGAALTSAGSIPEAVQANRQRALEERKQQIALQGEQARTAYQQVLTSREEMMKKQGVKVRSYSSPDGATHEVYLTPAGYQDFVSEPSATDRLSALEKVTKLTPEERTNALEQFMGIKATQGGIKPLTGEAGKPFQRNGEWFMMQRDSATGQIVETPLHGYVPPPLTTYQTATVDAKKSALDLAKEREKATESYRGSLIALRRAELDLKNNPNSPYYKLRSEQAATAAERAKAAMINATSGAYGTDLQGNALPGAQLTATGQPVGSKFQSNVRPTGQEFSRADLAASAREQLDDMYSILRKRKDIFGPIFGRTTDVTAWLGSQDPDAAAFKSAARIAADHLAGVFGGRSKEALEGVYNVIGQYKTNPEAAIRALDQMDEAASNIAKKGQRNVVGGAPGHAIPPTSGVVGPSAPVDTGDIKIKRDAQGNIVGIE